MVQIISDRLNIYQAGELIRVNDHDVFRFIVRVNNTYVRLRADEIKKGSPC
jgi:hypothetical protein